MKHYFNFDRITIGDIAPILASNPSAADWLALADKVVLGGVYALPATEVQAIVEATPKELHAWYKANVDTSALEDMLKGVDVEKHEPTK